MTQEEKAMKTKGLDPISEEELTEVLCKTKNKKAAHSEGIAVELLKYGEMLGLLK